MKIVSLASLLQQLDQLFLPKHPRDFVGDGLGPAHHEDLCVVFNGDLLASNRLMQHEVGAPLPAFGLHDPVDL